MDAGEGGRGVWAALSGKPSGQTTPSDDKKEWDFWADNPNLKCSTCGNPARTTLTDMEGKPKVYGPYYDTEGEPQAYCVYCNAAAYAENFYSNDYAFGSEEDGDDETLRELMESGVLFVGSKQREAADSGLAGKEKKQAAQKESANYQRGYRNAIFESKGKMEKVRELLKDAEDNIEGLEHLRSVEEISYRPVSLARQDVQEALSILKALAPTDAEQDRDSE